MECKAQQTVRGEISFDKDDCIVETGLVEVSEGRVFEDGGGFDDIDERMGTQIVKQPDETGGCVADVAPDPENRCVLFRGFFAVLPGIGRGEIECQIC